MHKAWLIAALLVGITALGGVVYGHGMSGSGMMPEVVVTAPRYYSAAEMGMMPEVTVTAPRYEGEDIAYSGMMGMSYGESSSCCHMGSMTGMARGCSCLFCFSTCGTLLAKI